MGSASTSDMPAYVVEIRREPLGVRPTSPEVVAVLADLPEAAVTLVKVALRLNEPDAVEVLEITRTLCEAEAKALGLKPFEVRHLSG